MSGFNVSFLSYGPQIVKNCALLQFLADVSKKSRAAIAFNVYTSKSSRFAFLENGISYYAMNYILQDISV